MLDLNLCCLGKLSTGELTPRQKLISMHIWQLLASEVLDHSTTMCLVRQHWSFELRKVLSLATASERTTWHSLSFALILDDEDFYIVSENGFNDVSFYRSKYI